jgi:PiT family inorganic phosphate transporter
MVLAWIVTVPAAALVAGVATLIVSTGAIGTVIVVLAAFGGMATFWWLSRRTPVTRHTVNEDADVLDSRPAAVAGGAK